MAGSRFLSVILASCGSPWPSGRRVRSIKPFPNRLITSRGRLSRRRPLRPSGARACAGFTVRLGVPVVVDNRPGGSGTVGAGHVARSAPDGYTLLVMSSANVTNPQSIKLPYDVMTDFSPIGMMLEGPPLIL